ncbi:GIY-YIG catalytic domain-containing protein [Bacillus wiedmannii]|uniref:GIY-YIG catalytic domain-containing protein n=1 Tax=Bacillus wiedmannii TaxID=1890302 RepID=A0A1G7AX84_9BACI|nr:GIY-YIG nuclease family protein [Bacillus wiedmannii]SDE19504.1 GIY-YIG catalytic domain-containing protein [Bacillus wiedmannii]
MGELSFMSFEEFNNKIQSQDSGVYLITDHNDKIVYVGKAFKIKTRVHAHFNGYSNTKDYAHLFNKVAYILEDSPLKRSLLEITYMIEYKTVLNKEVQEEFPDLYTDYIKTTNEKYKYVKMIPEIDKAFKQAKLEDAVRDIEKGKHIDATPQIISLQKERARERDRFKKEMFKYVGGKSMFYEILSLLDSGYNPNMLANALNIDIKTIDLLKERRKDFKIPRNHQRMIKHQDIMYSLSGRKSAGNSRLDHLL